MNVKRKILPVLVGAMMIGGSTVAYGQAAKMSAGFAKFEAASQELVKLYSAPDTKAKTSKITAAAKRKEAAEKAIGTALTKLNPKSKKDGQLAENIFGRMQALNEAVAKAQIATAASGPKTMTK